MKNSGFIQAIKFTLFSISAGVIQIVTTSILELFVDASLAWLTYLIGLILSVLWNFTFNRKFTFKSANNVPFAMFLVGLYYVVFTPLSLWGVAALAPYFPADADGIIATAIFMIINFVTEFIYQKYVVFRNSINSAVNEEEEKFKKIFKILKENF